MRQPDALDGGALGSRMSTGVGVRKQTWFPSLLTSRTTTYKSLYVPERVF